MTNTGDTAMLPVELLLDAGQLKLNRLNAYLISSAVMLALPVVWKASFVLVYLICDNLLF